MIPVILSSVRLPEHQKRLAELYQPPDDITFKGTLSQVMRENILKGSINIYITPSLFDD
jgi:hypothetical protein